jgi:alpha-beta hydrolase superfamily lysophospholipase
VTETAPARNGGALLVRHWPVVSDATASVLIVHGLGEHSGRYERTGSVLAGSGLDVTAFDLEGFGGSSGRRAYLERWDSWLDDLEDRLHALRAARRPVVLLGHSLGGLLALAYAESDRPQPDLLVLSAPALAADLPAWKKALVRILGRVAPTVSVANGLEGPQLSRDPAVGVDYLADPLNYHRTTTRLGMLLLEAQERAIADLGRLRVPTLVFHGGADPIVPTVSSEVLARLPGVTRRVYPDLCHETLNEPEGPQIAAEVAAWIGANLPVARSPSA